MGRRWEEQTHDWSALLDFVLDLDLRLSAATGSVVAVPRSAVTQVVDVFVRRSVHAVARADGSDWQVAVDRLAESLPGRAELAYAADRCRNHASSDVIVDLLVGASLTGSFALVVDEPVDATGRAVVDALQRGKHGILLLVVVDATSGPGTRATDIAVAAPLEHLRGPSDLVLLVALAKAPLTVTRLTRLLGVGWDAVMIQVETERERGVLHRASERHATVELRPGGDPRSLLASVPPDRLAALHRSLAIEFAGLSYEGGAVGLRADDAVVGAHHALAAGDDIGLVVDLCRRAANMTASAGDLEIAIDLLNQAAHTDTTLQVRVQLLSLISHYLGRLGRHIERGTVVRAARDVVDVLGDPVLEAEVIGRAGLTGRKVNIASDEPPLLRRLLDLGDRIPPHVTAMLYLRRAEADFLKDAVRCRALLDEAEAAAAAGDDVEVQSIVRYASLHLDVRRNPVHDDLVTSDWALGLGRVAVLFEHVHRALHSGTRSEFDTLVIQLKMALRVHPMAIWDADVCALELVQATFDGDRALAASAREGLDEGGSRFGALGAYWGYPLHLVWAMHTGRFEPFETSDIPISGEGGMKDFFLLSLALAEAEMGVPGALDSLELRLPDPATIPDDGWASSAQWPVLARVAYHVGSRELARVALERVAVPPDSWVLYGAIVPIAPCGYMTAETLRLVGRRADALAACTAGLEAAQRMRSKPWTAWCMLQKARLLHLDGAADEALELVEAASVSARRLELLPVLAAADRLRSSLASNLTGQEEEVLRLVVEGMANKQIARHLSLSVKRVERILWSAYRRLGVRNRAEAVRVMLSSTVDPDVSG